MRRVGGRVGPVGALVALLAMGTGDAAAQRRARGFDRPTAPGPVLLGIHALGGEAIGEMGLLVDRGFGLGLGASLPLDPRGHVRLRGDLGFLIYGHERQSMCFSPPVGCRIDLDLTTTNGIFFGGVGPELVVATGPVQPYVTGSFGFSWFATTSSLGGDDHYEDFASTTNHSDLVFAWRAGGGLRARVKGGRSPVYLDFAAERHENGVADYLTEGDIVDHPDGSITLFPTRSEANLVALRLGVSIGIPRGDDGRERRRRRGR